MAMMPWLRVEVRCRSGADEDGDSVRAESEWLRCPK